MKIATASFFTYSGPGRISIARSCPKYTPKGFRVFRELAPGPWFKSASMEEYLRLYRSQLSALEPRRVVDQLSELAIAAGAERAVLLCWEINPHDRWEVDGKGGEERPNCHRRIVAEWLGETLGLDVPELPPIVARDLLSDALCYFDPSTPVAPLSAAPRSGELGGHDRGYDEADIQATGTIENASGRFFALERSRGEGIWWPTEVTRPERSGEV